MPLPIDNAWLSSGRAEAAPPPPPPPPGFLEGLGANFTTARDNQMGRLQDAQVEAWAPLIGTLDDMGLNASRYILPVRSGAQINFAGVWGLVEEARRRDPHALQKFPNTQAEFEAQWRERFARRVEQTEQVASRAGLGTRIAGGFAGAMTDPINLATTPAGGWGRTIAMRLLTEAAVQGSLEAAQQPLINAERRAQGRAPMSGEQMAANVAGAALFGGALRGAAEIAPAIGRAGGKAADAISGKFDTAVMAQLDKLPAPLRERYLAGRYARAEDPALLADVVEALVGPENLSETERSALVVARREAMAEAGNPFAPDGAGAALHADLLAESWRAALDANPMDTSARAMATALAPPQAMGRRPVSAPLADSIDGYMAKVGGVESGGNDLARNPRSSAEGRYQFTDGTFLHYYRRRFGTGGLSREAILAKKRNPAVQAALMRDLTADNAGILRAAGITPDHGNLYLAHFAGPEGARKLHAADPEARAIDVLGREVVAANPFLRDMTARDVIAWAHRKMGTAPGAASVRVRGDLADYAEATRLQADLDRALGRAAQLADEQRRAAAGETELPAAIEAMAAPVERADLPDLPPQPVEARAAEPDAPRAEVLALLPRMREVVDDRSRSLNRTRELADELGASEQDVRDALTEMVREQRITMNRKRGTWMRKPPADTGPEDVLDFVARMGGIRDDEGHALGLRGVSARERRELHPAAIRNVKRRREGGGKRDWQRMTRRNGPLLRHEGLSVDSVGELLWAHGYLNGADGGRPTTAEVLDFLDGRIGSGKAAFPIGEAPPPRAAGEAPDPVDAFLREWEDFGNDPSLIDPALAPRAAELYGTGRAFLPEEAMRMAEAEQMAALEPPARAAFADPEGDPAKLQADSLTHDVRAELAAREAAETQAVRIDPFRLDEEGGEQDLQALLDAIDLEDIEFEEVRKCL